MSSRLRFAAPSTETMPPNLSAALSGVFLVYLRLIESPTATPAEKARGFNDLLTPVHAGASEEMCGHKLNGAHIHAIACLLVSGGIVNPCVREDIVREALKSTSFDRSNAPAPRADHGSLGDRDEGRQVTGWLDPHTRRTEVDGEFPDVTIHGTGLRQSSLPLKLSPAGWEVGDPITLARDPGLP